MKKISFKYPDSIPQGQFNDNEYVVLCEILDALKQYDKNIIEIEGHTDNVPIHTSRFASNNELSSARALSMFDYLVENTALEPSQIKHSGRGEYLPIADNSTPEGRALNRRTCENPECKEIYKFSIISKVFSMRYMSNCRHLQL